MQGAHEEDPREVSKTESSRLDSGKEGKKETTREVSNGAWGSYRYEEFSRPLLFVIIFIFINRFVCKGHRIFITFNLISFLVHVCLALFRGMARKTWGSIFH